MSDFFICKRIYQDTKKNGDTKKRLRWVISKVSFIIHHL